MKKGFSLSRRDVLRMAGKVAAGTMLSGLALSLYSTLLEPVWFDIEEVSLNLPNLPPEFSGFRIVHISDIHAGEGFMPEKLGEVNAVISQINPDVVVITGDFVDSSPSMNNEFLEQEKNYIKELSLIFPVYTILGNHDHWWNAKKVEGMLLDAGTVLLKNDFASLQRGGKYLHICGVDDYYVRKSDLGLVLNRLPQEGCAILLAHEPDFADESSVTGRFDLQLSGHSHGGQVSFPFTGPVVLPDYARKYPSGLYRVGDMVQYTNRGLGMVFPYVRFNCRPEITVFTLAHSS